MLKLFQFHLLSVLIFLGTPLQSTTAYAHLESNPNPHPCAQILTLAKTEISSLIAASGFNDRLTLKLFEKKILNRISRACAQKKECTPNHYLPIIYQEIEAQLSRSHKFRTHVAMASAAIIGSFLFDRYSPHLKNIPSVVSTTIALFIYAFAAPVIEPTLSKVRHFIFKPFSPIKHAFKGGKELNHELNRIWYGSQSTFNLNDQMSRNLLSQVILHISTQLHFQPDVTITPAVLMNKLAYLAYLLRNLYPEIDPQYPTVQGAVRAALAGWAPERLQTPDLREKFHLAVSRLDVHFDDPAAQRYYLQIQESWLP